MLFPLVFNQYKRKKTYQGWKSSIEKAKGETYLSHKPGLSCIQLLAPLMFVVHKKYLNSELTNAIK